MALSLSGKTRLTASLVAMFFLGLCLIESYRGLLLEHTGIATEYTQSWLVDDTNESPDNPLDFAVLREEPSVDTDTNTCVLAIFCGCTKLHELFGFRSRAPPA